jgi:hypothetical protein
MFRWLVLSILLVSVASEPSSAQARALLIFGQAGRVYPLVNLDPAGDDVSPSAVYGGGLGLQLSPTTAVRGMVNISKSVLGGPSVALDDASLTRSYCGFEVMLGAPSDAGLAPYIFFGGGRLSANPAQSGVDSFAKLAGHTGTGVNFVPDNSFFVFFLEASGLLYEFQLLGFEKLQFDAAVMGGIAFALPF